jgi:hypothetical protein
MKNLILTALCLNLFSITGCTTYARRKMEGKDTACVADLIDKGYDSGGSDSDSRRRALENGESYCYNYTEAERTKAKKLLDEGYFNAFGESHKGRHFQNALNAVRDYTPKQLECAKKEYKATPVADRRLLNVSEDCKHIK